MNEFCTVDQIKNLLSKYDKGYQGNKSEFLSPGSICLPKFVKHGVVREFETEEETTQK